MDRQEDEEKGVKPGFQDDLLPKGKRCTGNRFLT
jgi:hypothetical protein